MSINNTEKWKTWLSAFDRNSFALLPWQTRISKPFKLHAWVHVFVSTSLLSSKSKELPVTIRKVVCLLKKSTWRLVTMQTKILKADFFLYWPGHIKTKLTQEMWRVCTFKWLRMCEEGYCICFTSNQREVLLVVIPRLYTYCTPVY